ncbi:MAG: YgiT-type zinc finger protein [Anaerolineae bacterium]
MPFLCQLCSGSAGQNAVGKALIPGRGRKHGSGGPIIEKRVTLHRKVKENYVLIENMPAGVCTQCGTRYYAANVLKMIQETIRGRRKAEREVRVPVYSL